MFSGFIGKRRDATAPAVEAGPPPVGRPPAGGDPVAAAVRAGRYGLLIAPPEEWRKHPQYQKALATAVKAIDEKYAFVPEGIASLTASVYDEPGQPEVDVETAPFLLARQVVTNAEFQLFVDAGGYEDLTLWPEEILPHLIGFKDQTGHPGPRYWSEGCHDRRAASHPVVGVSYWEAAAYAAWAGYRLASEAEWQMAASWRIRSAANVQRRYPWGDGLDLKRCNIWAAGHRATLPADACSTGAAPNGVLQLIGNVWEWTNSDFEAVDREGRIIVGNTLMKSIRGGAFDTYFPWQATANFRTGLESLARVHNVGIRCALDLVER